jgi:hypothetical protein
MVRMLTSIQEKRSRVAILLALALGALALIIRPLTGLHVAAFLTLVGVPKDKATALAIAIVSTFLNSVWWIASLEWPIISPIAATIALWIVESGAPYAIMA